jgi:hypothetical protein
MKALISQSFDIFQTYGKQPEAIANMVQGFSMILHDHTDAEITEAFTLWMKTQSVLPTPANIFDLCEQARANSRKSSDDLSAAREATRKRLQAEYDAIQPMTEEEVQLYLQTHKAERTRAADRGKCDFSHFYRMPDDARQAVIDSIPECLNRLKISQ